jgi:O-antigen/teichoic acid export membrane protein
MAVSGSLRRVGFTFGGHLYNQIVTIGVQFALVPILLHAWGTERYGVWLVLSAIPTYLTFSDFGFTYIAKNEMTIKVAEGNQHGALVTYQSVFLLLNIAAVCVGLLAGAVIWATQLGAIFTLGTVTENQAKLVLLLLAANVIFYQYFMLFSAGARSIGRAATEVAWAATARLATGIVTAVTALAGGDLVMAAALGLLTNLLFGLAFHQWLRRVVPWLFLGWSLSSRKEVKRLVNPSVSYMFVSIAWATITQGPVVVLGIIAQPLEVVVFSTSRTLARLGTSVMNLVNSATWPEYSRLFGLKEIARFTRIFRLNLAIALAGTAAFIPVTILAAHFILDFWTKGQVTVEQPFFTLLVLSVAAEMIWTTLFAPLAAVNRHITISYVFAVLSMIGVIGCYLLGGPYGLPGTVSALLAVHGVMIFVVIAQLMRHGPWKV